LVLVREISHREAVNINKYISDSHHFSSWNSKGYGPREYENDPCHLKGSLNQGIPTSHPEEEIMSILANLSPPMEMLTKAWRRMDASDRSPDKGNNCG